MKKQGMMKGLAAVFLAAMLLVTLSGCASRPKGLSDVERVTFMRCIPEPATMEVFVLSSDLTVIQYDFTSYWIGNSFDYFTHPLPPEGEYARTERRITQEAWNDIVKALEDNRFDRLPEELKPVNGYDFPSYFVQVEANGDEYLCGGYGAGYGQDKASMRFKNVLEFIQSGLESDGEAELAGHKIVGFYFYYPSGSMPDNYYEIVKQEDGFMLTGVGDHRYGSFEVGIDEDALDALHRIIAKHSISAWHGFDQTAPSTMLTSANNRFSISIVYDNQTEISASGDHAFPDGYEAAEKALLQFFDELLTSLQADDVMS